MWRNITLAAVVVLGPSSAALAATPQEILAPVMGQMCVGTIGTMIRAFFRPKVEGDKVLLDYWADYVTGTTQSLMEPEPGYAYRGALPVEASSKGVTFKTPAGATYTVALKDGGLVGEQTSEAKGTWPVSLPCHASTTPARS